MTEEIAKKIIKRKEGIMTAALILMGVGCLMFLLGMLNIIFSQIGGILFLTGSCVGIIAKENKKYKAANEYMESKIRNEIAERIAEQRATITQSNEDQAIYNERFCGFAPVSEERNSEICDKFVARGIGEYSNNTFDEKTECINETETEPKYFSEGIVSKNVINLGTRWSGPGDFSRVWLEKKENRWFLYSEDFWPFSRGASNGGCSEDELTKDYFMKNKIKNVDDWLKKIFRGENKPCIDIIKKDEAVIKLLSKIILSRDVEVDMKDDAIKAIRNDIIQKITKKPSDKYEIGSLLWEDAADCFGKPWDYAGFYLNLRTKELYVNASTYPDRSNYHESTWSISVTEFHKISTRYFNKFQNLKCEEDWELLFDSELQSAVDKALEILEKGKEAERKRNAIVLGNEYFCRTPEMNFQEIVLELNQAYDEGIVKVTQDEKKYHIYYEYFSMRAPHKSYKCKHDLILAEAVWLETTVDETMRNKDVSTWKSIVGGDSMNISIKKSGHKPYEYTGRPINKYTELMREIERLAKYGSKQLDETKN